MKNGYRQASFRGVPFFVETNDLEVGRRLVKHEYPYSDTPFIEDMGGKIREFPLEAYVLGANYSKVRDDLIVACGEKGVGEFIHPTFGSLKVVCESCRVHENMSEGGFARFSLTFIEAGEKLQPTVTPDTGSAVRAASKSAKLEVKNDFTKVIQIAGQPGFVSNDCARVLEKGVSLVENGSAFINAEKQKMIESFNGDLNNLLNSSLSKLADDIIYLVSDADKPELIANKASNIKSEVPMTTPSRIAQANNQDASVSFFRRLAIISQAEKSSVMQFASYQDALTIRNDIADKLDCEMENTQNDDLYFRLSSLRTAVVQDIDKRGTDLRRVVSYDNKETRPALVIAYDVYGDSAREDEVIYRNNIIHPGFVAGGKELELLSYG